MSPQFDPVFTRLRDMLQKCSDAFDVSCDIVNHYCLSAPIGPATVLAWRGKTRSETIPVAWVKMEKAYVSYHLMGVYGNPKLLDSCSQELLARMQGKSCFNFKSLDEPLFEELRELTLRSLEEMRQAGYIAPAPSKQKLAQ